MSLKTELNNLKNNDIYSLLLFTLFQCRQTNEYSALSELSYILDETNLLNLLEYFGGMTLTIPTIDELELLLCGLNVFQSVHIEGLTIEDSLLKYVGHKFKIGEIQKAYTQISDVMINYSFGEENNDKD